MFSGCYNFSNILREFCRLFKKINFLVVLGYKGMEVKSSKSAVVKENRQLRIAKIKNTDF